MNIKIIFALLSYVLSKEIHPFLKNTQILTDFIASSNLNKTKGLVIKCFWFETSNFTIFDLKKLENNTDDSYFFESKAKTKIHYNFCGNVAKKLCNEQESQVISYEADSKCSLIGGPYKGGNTWELLDASNYTKGVKITLNSGDKCNDKAETYSTTYEIQCAPSQKELVLSNSDEFDEKKCTNTLKFLSQHACPNESILSVIQFFVGKKMIFASILIICGLFELILGKKLLTATTYIISAGCLTGLVFLFIIQFTIPSSAVDAVLWVALSISVIAGLAIGFFVATYQEKVLPFILGGFCGYLVGTVLYAGITCNFFPELPTLTNIATVGITIVIFIVITFFFFSHIVIIGTSLIGAFFVVFGLGIFIGNFPNLSLIMQLIKNGEKEQWDSLWNVWVYCYIGAWLVLFVGGTVVQYYLNKEDTEDEENKDTFASRSNSKAINN